MRWAYILSRKKKREGRGDIQHFCHWFKCHVRLLLLLRSQKALHRQICFNISTVRGFFFHKQKFLSTRGFSCWPTTLKFLKLLWFPGLHGHSSNYPWMEVIQNSFCGALLVVGSNSVTKTSRPAAGQAGQKVTSCTKLTNQRKRFLLSAALGYFPFTASKDQLADLREEMRLQAAPDTNSSRSNLYLQHQCMSHPFLKIRNVFQHLMSHL